jgi:hypothetical protein
MNALREAEQALSRLVVLAESSRYCPYRAADAGCQAGFGCRNQHRDGESLICTAAPDDLNWRRAWETAEATRAG